MTPPVHQRKSRADDQRKEEREPGKTDQTEYQLTGKLVVIGKSDMATIKLRGWLKPKVAAQITKRDDGFYIGKGDKVPSVNGIPISGPTRLNEGDIIEVAGVKLNFNFRD